MARAIENAMVQRPTNGEVHVWLVQVADALTFHQRLLPVLSAEERERAERYRHTGARNEFLAARACLRLLLGHVLQRSPQSLTFAATAHGKLQVPGVDFNLSHSRDWVAIAVSAAGPVGIDIEQEDRRVELLDVAEAVFTPLEVSQLRSAASDRERRRLFFEMWTGLEARAKCLGLGLGQLDEVRGRSGQLYLQKLTMPAGYQGALCFVTAGAVIVEHFLGKQAIEGLLNGRYHQ